MQEEWHGMTWLGKSDASVPLVPCSPPDETRAHKYGGFSRCLFSYRLVLGRGKLASRVLSVSTI